MLAAADKGVFDAYDKWERKYRNPVTVGKMYDIVLFHLDSDIKYFAGKFSPRNYVHKAAKIMKVDWQRFSLSNAWTTCKFYLDRF